MIHFKLKMEYEEEKKKYFGLYRIGILDSEIKKIVLKKISAIYYIPIVYAVVISITYNYYTNSSYGYGAIGIAYGSITAIIICILHIVVCKLYSNAYYKKI